MKLESGNQQFARVTQLLLGKAAVKGPQKLKKGDLITEEYLESLPKEKWFEIAVADAEDNDALAALAVQFAEVRADYDKRYDIQSKKITQGDDLAPGVLKVVKVYMAIKRRIQPGDKMRTSWKQRGYFNGGPHRGQRICSGRNFC